MKRFLLLVAVFFCGCETPAMREERWALEDHEARVFEEWFAQLTPRERLDYEMHQIAIRRMERERRREEARWAERLDKKRSYRVRRDPISRYDEYTIEEER